MSLIGLFIAWIYLPWFRLGQTLSSGDWPYLFRETIVRMPAVPGNQALWLDTYYHLTAKLGVQMLGLTWEVTEKLFWFYPFLLISLLSSFLFVHSVFSPSVPQAQRRALALVGSLIYTVNSYILMIVGGGQMGVALAYSLAPLVLKTLIDFINNTSLSTKIKNIIWPSVILAIQLMFDPRLFVVTLLAGVVLIGTRAFVKLFFVIGAAVLLNAFWILPNVLRYRELYDAATGGDIVGFLSFATFSNAISLLHPNWPQNIFGKIGFMKPEFLTIPILAFGSLLIMTKMKKVFVSFAVLALVGAFLSKGVNEPFGIAYRFLAQIPGFMIFRDPTKFYLLVAISYSVLIPYTLRSVIASPQGVAISSIFERLLRYARNDKAVQNLVLGSFLLLWIFIHRQAFLGQLTGTFRPRTVPPEYVRLKDFFLHQGKDYSVLWVPRIQRFGFYSDTVQAFNSQDDLADVPPEELVELLATASEDFVRRERVAFVAVPYDSEEEIFLTDRKYDHTKRLAWESAIDGIHWLEKLAVPGVTERITLYKIRQ